jgi:dUTP pyrophosphatase
MLSIPLKRLPHAFDLPLPTRATAGAAGFDLRAAVGESITLAPMERRLVPTGLVLAIPEGWEGQVRPRSGLAIKHGITLINAPGTIDSDYRGELLVPLVNLGAEAFVITRGERIAQILFSPVPAAEFVELPELPDGAGTRGGAGFGSTGTR